MKRGKRNMTRYDYDKVVASRSLTVMRVREKGVWFGFKRSAKSTTKIEDDGGERRAVSEPFYFVISPLVCLVERQ